MQQTNTYLLSARGIPVEVERKAVRRVNLRVRGDGSARMSVPWRMGRAQAQAFLDAHAEWLERSVAHAKTRQEAVDEAREQGLVPLWGKKARLEPGEDAAQLYRREVERALPAAVARMEAASGLHASAWQVRDMKSRWGSCTPATGRIRISSRLAAYPPICLEYVVAHELAHLAEPSHSGRFHEIVAGFFPHEKEARALLRN